MILKILLKSFIIKLMMLALKINKLKFKINFCFSLIKIIYKNNKFKLESYSQNLLVLIKI